MREILGYGIGDTVIHSEYGIGRVEDIVPTDIGKWGPDHMVLVRFVAKQHGVKCFFARRVELKRVPVD